MRKLLPVTHIIIMLFLSLISHGQQPVLEVKTFEYTWQSGNSASNVIIALDDLARFRMKNSFAKAIKARWNLELPDVLISAKPLSMMVYKPKFKTQLKEIEPGKWYLFLQVYENNNIPNFILEGDAISTSLELRCMIVNGANDSVIINKTLTVNIRKNSAPIDQVPLIRLPAYPPSFVQGFDSIATWLFEPEPVSQKTLIFRPACIFQQTIYPDVPINKLTFQRDVMGIHQLTTPSFTLQPSTPKYEQIGIKRNAGGRSLGGAFTMLTGLGSGKTKYYKYKADCSFKDTDSTWHCLIGYTEEESAERVRVKNEDGSYSMQSSDYKLSARYTDPHFLNMITLEADTLATFAITNIASALSLNNYDQLWDGTDSTTIVHLPPEWNNKAAEKDIVIAGRMGNDTFTMKTWKGKRIKEFYINNQLVITVQGRYAPVNGQLYHPVSAHQLKIFTILALLPYAYFSETYFN